MLASRAIGFSISGDLCRIAEVATLERVAADPGEGHDQ